MVEDNNQSRGKMNPVATVILWSKCLHVEWTRIQDTEILKYKKDRANLGRCSDRHFCVYFFTFSAGVVRPI